MPTRRAGLLTSLLLTAALLCAMPGLLASMEQAPSRAAPPLMPARARTLTVWLLPEGPNDQKWLRQTIAAFEKAREGARVFLRSVSQEELYAPEAVLPDAVLFGTGGIAMPQDCLLPLDALEGGVSAEESGGVRYAMALWTEPNVLCVPKAWLEDGEAPLTADGLPWRALLSSGALEKPSGVALQQLLYACPASLRGELIAAFDEKAQVTPTPLPTAKGAVSLPKGQGATPPPVKGQATVRTLAQYLADSEEYAACALAPAVSDRTRYLGLCRDSDDARAFAAFLLEQAQGAMAQGLMPLAPDESQAPNALAAELARLFSGGAAQPNAFAHTRQELLALCEDAFERGENPVETLLRLR